MAPWLVYLPEGDKATWACVQGKSPDEGCLLFVSKRPVGVSQWCTVTVRSLYVHNGLCRNMTLLYHSTFSINFEYIWGLGGCFGFCFCFIKRRIFDDWIVSPNSFEHKWRHGVLSSLVKPINQVVVLLCTFVCTPSSNGWQQKGEDDSRLKTLQIRAVVAWELLVATLHVLLNAPFTKCSSFFLRSFNISIVCSRPFQSSRRKALFFLCAVLGFGELGAVTDHCFSMSSWSWKF